MLHPASLGHGVGILRRTGTGQELHPQTEIPRQRPRNESITTQPNLIRQFIRTVQERPDLASHVDAMQIACWEPDDAYPLRSSTPEIPSSPDSLSDSDLAPEVWSAASRLYAANALRPLPLDSSKPEGVVRDLVTAIQSCPRLRSLLVSYSDDEPLWPDGGWLKLKMPSICRLGVIVGIARQSALYLNFVKLQTMTPNVEAIHASTGGYWLIPRDSLKRDGPINFLPKLKRLSLAGMREPQLEELVLSLPGLEHLEITNLSNNCMWRKALKPVQNGLKSLHVSYCLQPHQGMEFWDVKFRHSERFRFYGALEELSLDSRLIRDIVGVCEYALPGHESKTAEMEDPMRQLFEAVGIEFLWTKDLVSEQLRPGSFLWSGMKLTSDIPLPVAPSHEPVVEEGL
ncbi:hypothetical protein CORC01_09269 [Colletotrichum orchidophilum]|uniref:Uncharacterized protein n=1 Tax=Colletotrichum orchidophilum TaxID=1209926 RepID=A0A1G4B1Z5_9PEZI|nr:uncharacterized protein CORC01_09269 [Colletotrichum orchidophilum]OHE95397.1 hypothetical protein CORC01_09269 [Colletotrichum orchidophilum]